MKKVLLFLLFMGILFCSHAVCAADFSARYDIETEGITYEGKFDVGERIKMFILPDGMNPSQLTEAEENIYIFSQEAGSDGTFEHSIQFSDRLPMARYYIFAVSGETEKKCIVFPAEKAKMDVFISALNIQPQDEWADYMKANMPMDNTAISTYGDAFAEVLYSRRPAGGYTAEKFMTNYILYEGIFKWRSSDISFADFLSEYSGYTDIPFETAYNMQSAAVKKSVESVLSTYDLKAEAFDKKSLP